MLQDFVWNTFEKTGNVDAYLFYKQVEQIHSDKNISTHMMQENLIESTSVES